MTYTAQTFSVLEVLGATKMNQIETNVRDHKHGNDGVTLNDSRPYLLTNLLHSNFYTSRKDLFRLGYLPAFFNQQWGGGVMPFEGLTDGATGTIYSFDSRVCNVYEMTTSNVGDASSRTYQAQSFKVPAILTSGVAAIWVKVYKVGDPTNDLSLKIYNDSSGSPNALITNGTATAIDGKLFSSKSDGEWVRFAFATPPTLSANTTYHIVLNSSGAVDASNYWILKAATSKVFPHGFLNTGDGTPTWTQSTTTALAFVLEPIASLQYVQEGGEFGDGKIIGHEGTPLDLSTMFTRPLKGRIEPTEFTAYFLVSSLTKDKTFWEMHYGFDHDRIVLRCNVTTGFAQVDVYESDGTKHTVTATSVDLSSSDVHQVTVHVRAKGDGSDRVDLLIDGAANGTAVTAATISFSENFRELGTEWLLGGFALAPTWDDDQSMSALPSADGWTWTGTGTEASCMSVAGGKLYQNYGGYTSTQSGYYVESGLSLSNTNGWGAVFKARVSRNTNNRGEDSAVFRTYDGTARVDVRLQEFFVSTGQYGVADSYVQADLRSKENCFLSVGKGTDHFLFMNGRLISDGTGQLTGATATNGFEFGDADTTAGENADVVWDYVKYYDTTWLAPQGPASGVLHEYAIWEGDARTLISPLYNEGSFQSIKAYCGINDNWYSALKEWEHVEPRSGLTSSPTTTDTSFPPDIALAELEAFVLGETVWGGHLRGQIANSSDTSAVYVGVRIDGELTSDNGVSAFAVSGGNGYGCPSLYRQTTSFFGLHKLVLNWGVSGGTGTANTKNRGMVFGGKL